MGCNNWNGSYYMCGECVQVGNYYSWMVQEAYRYVEFPLGHGLLLARGLLMCWILIMALSMSEVIFIL